MDSTIKIIIKLSCEEVVMIRAEAAKRVLQRRVDNSPPARGEARWLAGWRNRCDSYKRSL